MTRAFVAIDLPEAVRGQLSVLQFLLPLPDRVDPTQFHLTLAFLDDLRDAELQAVHEALSALRLPPDDAMRLERAVAAQLDFRAAPFTVRDFALLASTLHRDGARHEVLARYPLGGISDRIS